jgi:hypothetical protein
MHIRLMQVGFGLLAAMVFAAPSARAFTIEDKDAAGQFTVPKFDLEEQSKNFSKGSGDPYATGKTQWDTPVGKLQFGVGSGAWDSGSPSALSRNSRQDFNRITAPPTSAEFNGVR